MNRRFDDPRIRVGMGRMLAARQALIDAGSKPIGWKLGFGSPAARDRLGIDAPLIGFLTDRTLVASGEAVAIQGWRQPMIEPEVAVYMATDLVDGADPARVAVAIGALGPAIELADVDADVVEVESIMAANIFHRAVVLGESDPGRAGGRRQGLVARVYSDGEERAATPDLESLTGEMLTVIGSLADLLNAAGERLRQGELVITGSVVPPIPGVGVSEATFELSPFPPISVRLR
ncbi:MAG: hypothetical protein ACRDWH_05585 [Acidimicrobiia bacterium]